MNYKFNKNVYLVVGAKKHCIYDLQENKLYHINQRVLDLINKLFKKDFFYLNIEINEQKIIDQLITYKILIKSIDKGQIPNILLLKKPFSIRFAWIEVTRQCNLSCIFCYEKSNPYCTESIDLDNFYYVCSQLQDIGVKRIQLIGGEPMVLKKNLKLMIEHCYNNFDFIEVYTNGTLINEDWAKFFKEYNIAIALSIHSYIADEHDALTKVKGSHKKVLNGLELLKKHNIQYRIGTVRNANCNIGEKTPDINYILSPKEPKITGRTDFSQYNFEMFEKKAITKKTFSYSINKNAVITALSGHRCFIKDLYIDTQLEVFPCVMERRISHGNLKEKKLTEIINNKIRFLSKDNIEECKDCEFRYACFDCRPDSNGKKIFQKPWYCTYDPKAGKWHDVKEIFKNMGVSVNLQ